MKTSYVEVKNVSNNISKVYAVLRVNSKPVI